MCADSLPFVSGVGSFKALLTVADALQRPARDLDGQTDAGDTDGTSGRVKLTPEHRMLVAILLRREPPSDQSGGSKVIWEQMTDVATICNNLIQFTDKIKHAKALVTGYTRLDNMAPRKVGSKGSSGSAAYTIEKFGEHVVLFADVPKDWLWEWVRKHSDHELIEGLYSAITKGGLKLFRQSMTWITGHSRFLLIFRLLFICYV